MNIMDRWSRKFRGTGDVDDSVTAMARLLAQQGAQIAERIGQLERAVAEVVTQSRAMDDAGGRGSPGQADIIQGGILGASTGTSFSLRYRNDTLLGDEDGTHRLEWIAKSSPFQPNEDGTAYVQTGDYATDYAHCWPAEDWNAVFGGDAVECEWES